MASASEPDKILINMGIRSLEHAFLYPLYNCAGREEYLNSLRTVLLHLRAKFPPGTTFHRANVTLAEEHIHVDPDQLPMDYFYLILPANIANHFTPDKKNQLCTGSFPISEELIDYEYEYWMADKTHVVARDNADMVWIDETLSDICGAPI